MKILSIIIAVALFFCFYVSIASQTLNSPPLDAGDVYLKQVCKSADNRVKFSFQNHTKWAISVDTASLYADVRKYATYKLNNGGSVLVLNDQQEVPLFHWIIQRLNGQQFSLVSMASDTGADSWIAPGKSITFWVESRFLLPKSTVFTTFHYEWEIGANGFVAPSYIEHRIYDSTWPTISQSCKGAGS